MAQFEHSLVIQGEPSLLLELITQLKQIGHRWVASKTDDYKEYPLLCTRYHGDYEDGLGFIDESMITKEESPVIRLSAAQDKDLILALASMRKGGDKFYKGEWVVALTDFHQQYTKGKLYCITSVTKDHVINTIDDKGADNGAYKTHFRKATAREIISHFNTKKVSGVKFKPGFIKYYDAVSVMLGRNFWSDRDNGVYELKQNEIDVLKEIGILDLWFEVVYETSSPVFKLGDIVYVIDGGNGAWGANKLVGEIVSDDAIKTKHNGMLKTDAGINIRSLSDDVIWRLNPKCKLRLATDEEKIAPKTFTLQCSDGQFEIVVSKKAIVYPVEKRELPADDLKKVIDMISLETPVRKVGCYKFQVTHIDSGCKKQVPISQWKQVLDYYYSLQR